MSSSPTTSNEWLEALGALFDTTSSPQTTDSVPVSVTEETLTFKGLSRTLDTANDVEDIVDAISKADGLVEFTAGGNTIGLDAMISIVTALKTKPLLKRLDFDDCFTRRKEIELHPSVQALGELFVSSKHLVEIGLCDNALSPEGAKFLAPAISMCTSLTVIRLDNTGVGPLGGKLLGLGLLEGARRGLRLKVFSLGRSRLENKGVKSIATALKHMTTLEVINLPNNGIRESGIVALAAAIEVCKDLKFLDLTDNTFGKKGSVAMGRAFASLNGKIETLILGDCLLKKAGFETIFCNFIDKYPHMQKLDISFNDITAQNLDTLCKVITRKSHLQCLELNGNIFTQENIKTIVASVAHNRQILGDIDELEDPDEEDDNDDDDDDTDDEDDDDEDDDDKVDGQHDTDAVTQLLQQLGI